MEKRRSAQEASHAKIQRGATAPQTPAETMALRAGRPALHKAQLQFDPPPVPPSRGEADTKPTNTHLPCQSAGASL